MKKIVLIISFVIVCSFFYNENGKLTNFDKKQFAEEFMVEFYNVSDPGGGS